MIEVNLIPGGKKRPSRIRTASFSFPKLGALPSDRWTLGGAAVSVAALGWMVLLFLGVRSDRAETQVALDAAVQDSVRFSDLITRTQLLTARRDSISQRVGVLQQIDQHRYAWPHLLDEVARALPDYTWLSELTQTESEPLAVRLTGQAGNNFALTVFMEQLEASVFLQGVTLIQSQQEFVGQGGGIQQLVQGFVLDVSYVEPPMEFLETVPLLAGETATQTEARDTTTALPGGAG